MSGNLEMMRIMMKIKERLQNIETEVGHLSLENFEFEKRLTKIEKGDKN